MAQDNFQNDLNDLLNRIKAKVVQALPEVIEQGLKPEIIAFSPTTEEEREMLSKDVAGIGTYEGGRFLRQADGGVGMPFREAVAIERPVTSGDTVSFLSKENLRNNTIFAWRRRNGEILSINPDDWFFVNALEYGGARYTVTPRSDRKFLYPQDNMFKQYMVKAIYPRRMMWLGLNSTGFKAVLMQKIEQIANEKL